MAQGGCWDLRGVKERGERGGGGERRGRGGGGRGGGRDGRNEEVIEAKM